MGNLLPLSVNEFQLRFRVRENLPNGLFVNKVDWNLVKDLEVFLEKIEEFILQRQIAVISHIEKNIHDE